MKPTIAVEDAQAQQIRAGQRRRRVERGCKMPGDKTRQRTHGEKRESANPNRRIQGNTTDKAAEVTRQQGLGPTQTLKRETLGGKIGPKAEMMNGETGGAF